MAAFEPATIGAYRLPSLTPIRTVHFARTGPGEIGLGASGDLALLMDVTGDGGPTKAYAWNLRTGALTGTNVDVNLWGMSNGGQVVRRVFPTAGARPRKAASTWLRSGT